MNQQIPTSDQPRVAVIFGRDETSQFATDLDSTRNDVTMISGKPITELTDQAADWLEQEMQRPIVRYEWDRLDKRGVAPRRWGYADNREGLTAMETWSADFGPPDRIISVSIRFNGG